MCYLSITRALRHLGELQLVVAPGSKLVAESPWGPWPALELELQSVAPALLAALLCLALLDLGWVPCWPVAVPQLPLTFALAALAGLLAPGLVLAVASALGPDTAPLGPVGLPGSEVVPAPCGWSTGQWSLEPPQTLEAF